MLLEHFHFFIEVLFPRNSGNPVISRHVVRRQPPIALKNRYFQILLHINVAYPKWSTRHVGGIFEWQM